MGCYDTVHFTCPECHEVFEEQSKAGKCCLREYQTNSIPTIIGAALNGKRIFCPHCGTEFAVETRTPRRVELHLSRVDDDD